MKFLKDISRVIQSVYGTLMAYRYEVSPRELAEDLRVVGRALLIAGLTGLFLIGNRIEGILLSVLAVLLLLEANKRIR